MNQALTLAGQIFCARAGEVVVDGKRNRPYGEIDTLADAARLMTLALNADNLERLLGEAATELGLQTIWPDELQADQKEDIEL